MQVTLITQDEPFYLAENIDFLIRNFPEHSTIVSCVVFDPSPHGKKQSTLQRLNHTRKIFGWKFLLRFGWKFLMNKLDAGKKVYKVLEKHQIPVIRLEKKINHADSLAKIKAYQPDLLISVQGNQIFRKPLIELCPKGCINLHTALLPKYRGLMPTFWVLKNNEKYTGVSVFYVDEGIDSGPIIVQKRVEIGDRSLEALIKHTKQVGMEAILESVDLIQKDAVTLIENDEKQQTYFSFPERKDVEAFLKQGKKFY